MRILNKKDFLKLPEQTLFSYYAPGNFRELNIKLDTVRENDFLDDSIIGAVDAVSTGDLFDKLDVMSELGGSAPMDFEQTDREGLYENEQLYAVYEKEDVEKLIARLQKTLRGEQ
jgi:hypothetical protein